MGWRQGKVFVYQNLVTGQKTYSGAPLFGEVGDELGLTPNASFKVIRRGLRRPKPQVIAQGIVDIYVSRDGLLFRPKRRQRRVRDGTFMRRGGLA